MPASPPDQVIHPALSVVIITRNEAHRIERCLRSVAFADEWIVVDSGSSDETVAIAQGLGADVRIYSDWPGFGPQKNRALALAKGRWVLSLDADELVSDELAAAIAQTVAGKDSDLASLPKGYWLLRQSSFCGRVIRYGDWSGDRVLRLFQREAGRFSDDIVHERVEVLPPHGQLNGILLHDSVETMADGQDKMRRYARLGAIKLRAKRMHKTRAGLAIEPPIRAAWTFFRGLFLRLGIFDGMAGFRIAMLNAQGTYLRYHWAADRSRTLDLNER